jgi:hypothetical protein
MSKICDKLSYESNAKKLVWVKKCYIKRLSPEIILLISEKEKNTQYPLRCTCKYFFSIFSDNNVVYNARAYDFRNNIQLTKWIAFCKPKITEKTLITAASIGNISFLQHYELSWLPKYSIVMITAAKYSYFNIVKHIIHRKIGIVLDLLTSKLGKNKRRMLRTYYNEKKYESIYYQLGIVNFIPYISDTVYDCAIISNNIDILLYLDSVNIEDRPLHYRIGFLGKPQVFNNHHLSIRPFLEGCIASGRMDLVKSHIIIYETIVDLNREIIIKIYTDFMKFACYSKGLEMLEYLYSNFPMNKSEFKKICIVNDDEKENWFKSKNLEFLRI